MSQTSRSDGLTSTTHVSALIAATREEVKSREAGNRPLNQGQGNKSNQSLSGSGCQSARQSTHPRGGRLVSSVTKGQYNRTFFTNTPIFTMPPLGTPPTEPLFFKTNSQATIQQKQQAAYARNQSNGSIASQYGASGGADHNNDELLYSPDIPPLVPYQPTQPMNRGGPIAPMRGSTTSLHGNLPPSVFRTPYQSFGVLPPNQYNPPMPPPPLASIQAQQLQQQRASRANLNHTTPASFSHQQSQPTFPINLAALSQPTLQPPPPPPPAPISMAASQARLARTHAPNSSSQQQLGAPKDLQSSSSAGSISSTGGSARLELLEYLQSPECGLFTSQLQVLGTELDSLLQLCGGIINTLNILQAMDTRQARFGTFGGLLESVRLQVGSTQPTLHSSNSGLTLRASGHPIPGMNRTEEKTEDGLIIVAVPPPKLSKAQRKAALMVQNGGQEEPNLSSAQLHADREATMTRVVEFIASPSCLLFPEHNENQSSGVDGQPDEPDIKIEQKDLNALVECGSQSVLMSYLYGLNQQITAFCDANKSKTHPHHHLFQHSPPFQCTQPFKHFTDLLHAVQAIHARTIKAKTTVRNYLNSHECKLFTRIVVEEKKPVNPHPHHPSHSSQPQQPGSRLYPGSASTKSLKDSASTKSLSPKSSHKNKDSLLNTNGNRPPRFTLYDMDRLWLDSEIGIGEEVLGYIKTSENDGVRILTKPYLKQLMDVIQQIHSQQQKSKHPNNDATNAAQVNKKKKLLQRQSSEKALVSSPNAPGSQNSDPTGSTHTPSATASGDPVSSFESLTPRAQRFVVELTAFFRSPKCKVFVDTPIASTKSKDDAPSATDNKKQLASSSRPSPPFLVIDRESKKTKTVGSMIIDAITNEDLVALMRVAGETELLQSELVAKEADDSTRRHSGGLDSFDPKDSRQLANQTNRALFFLTALNTAITLPKPTMQPVRDWSSLLGAVQFSHEQSLIVQGHLLERLTNSHCKLFANMQVRRVSDSYQNDFNYLQPEEDERDENDENEERGSRSRSRSKSLTQRKDSTTNSPATSHTAAATTELNAPPTHSHGESDDSNLPSERLLYLSSFDMHRLFFESTAGIYVESYLDSFESAVPPRTFFDFNGLVFGVKVAHLLWLSQQKQDQVAPETPSRKKSNKDGPGSPRSKKTPTTSPKGHQTNESGAQTSSSFMNNATDDPALEAYRQLALGGAEPSTDDSSKQHKSVSTQTPLTTAPIGSLHSQSRTTPDPYDATSSPKSPVVKQLHKDEKVIVPVSTSANSLSLSELGVHLRSTTVQALLFDPSILPLTITDADLHTILESIRDLNETQDLEADEWNAREFAEKLKAWEKEVEIAHAMDKPVPPPLTPPEKSHQQKPPPTVTAGIEMDPSSPAAQTAANLATTQAEETKKCALVLTLLHQLEAPALAANAVAGNTTAPTTPAPTPSAAAETTGEHSRSFSIGSLSRSKATPAPTKFHTIPQLCDALYYEHALYRSKEETLAFLKSTACRLLPEGAAPMVHTHTQKDTPHLTSSSSSASAAAASKLQNMTTGGPHGTISANDVSNLYRLAKAGLYTLPILWDLNSEHLRAFDLDSLISMVSGSHISNISRIKSQKFLLLTHLSGNKCRIFPTPVRVTDAHLDLLLTATHNSGSAALYYLHQLSLHHRTFSSMDGVIGAIRYMMSHPNPFKDRLKQLLSSPMCIVMNRQKERVPPTDSIIDRLWDVQQAGIDSLTHIQSLHADAQGFTNYIELITAVGANQASCRSSQQESEKWMILTHLCSPLNGLFSYPLYDITITPKHLESLLAAGGNSASVVLYHLEHLDLDPPLGYKGTFDGMPPLIQRLSETHALVRVQDERLLIFLNSRLCQLFRNVPSTESIPPFDEVAVERLLNESGASAQATLNILHVFNNESPPRSFTSFAQLVSAVSQTYRSDPVRLGPGRSRNSLNNFGQSSRDLSQAKDTLALPISEPVRLSFPGDNSTESGLVFANDLLQRKPSPLLNPAFSVDGPFYSDGSVALDAEDGVAGHFIVDPNQLYDSGTASRPGTPGGSRKPSIASRPGSGRIHLSRPSSAKPDASLIDPAQIAIQERDRELIIDYLSTRCNLFRTVELDQLEVTQDALDESIAIAGSAKNVLLELTRMDAIGKQFTYFNQLISALKHACDATKRMESTLENYRHPDEEIFHPASSGSNNGDSTNSQVDNPISSTIYTPQDLQSTLPRSVRQTSVSSQDVLTVGSTSDSPRAGLAISVDLPTNGKAAPKSGPPSIYRNSSLEISNKLARTYELASALVKGEPIDDKVDVDNSGTNHKFTDGDYQALRESIKFSQVLRLAQEKDKTPDLSTQLTLIDLTQILLVGRGLEHTQLHLKRFKQCGRQIENVHDIARVLLEAEDSGIYSSANDLADIEAFLSVPKNQFLKAYLNSTEIPISFRDLPKSEIDLWSRSCGGSKDLIYYLTFVAKYNRHLAKLEAGKLDLVTGLKVEPTLYIPSSPSDLITTVHDLARVQRENLAKDMKTAALLRQQARQTIQAFLSSDSCFLLANATNLAAAPVATSTVTDSKTDLTSAEQAVLCTDEQADIILNNLSPNAYARTDPDRYQPSEPELEVVIERLNKFDSVGRKFPSVQALATACKVVYSGINKEVKSSKSSLTTSTAKEKTDTSTSSTTTEVAPIDQGDNIPGSHVALSQRKILGAYLSSDSCGLLPVDAQKQFDALTGEALDELFIAITSVARSHNLHPLVIARGKPVLPRYVVPFYRLQQRSPSGGSNEYQSISQLIRALKAMATESPIKKEFVRAAVDYLTSDTECSLFSTVPSDAGLELHENDIEDAIRLVGDWPTLHQTLQKLDSCGVKVASMANLQAKLQRVLTYGIYSSEVERKELINYFNSRQNNILVWSSKRAQPTDQELDSLLFHSKRRGAAYLIEVVFRRITNDHQGSKAENIAELVEWIVKTEKEDEERELVQAIHSVSKKSNPNPQVEEEKTAEPTVPPAREFNSNRTGSHIELVEEPKTATTPPAESTPEASPAPLEPVDAFKSTSVITFLSSTACTIFSESLENIAVTEGDIDHLIREVEKPHPGDIFQPDQLSLEERNDQSLYHLKRLEAVFTKCSNLEAIVEAINRAKQTGSYVLPSVLVTIQSHLTTYRVLKQEWISLTKDEPDQLIIQCNGLLGLESTLASLQREGRSFDSVKELIQHIQTFKQQQKVDAVVAAEKQAATDVPILPDSDHQKIISFLTGTPVSHKLLPLIQLPSIPDSILLSWITECSSIDSLLQRLEIFVQVRRNFPSAAEILPALIELSQTGLGVSIDVKKALVDYFLDEQTHLFVVPNQSPTPANHHAIHSATGAEITQLFVVGNGLNNLITRLSYLDAIGEHFSDLATLITALKPLTYQIAPSDDDRNQLIQHLGSVDCHLFDNSSEPTMEISTNEIDAMILCPRASGINGCLKALKELDAEGWRVSKLDQLLSLLLGRDTPGAKKEPVAPAPDPLSPLSPEPAAAVAASSPQPPPANDNELAAPDHQKILEFLGSEDISLFSPLAETGAELEITDSELDHLISATENRVELTIKVMKVLDNQKRGFLTLAELSAAVAEEYTQMKQMNQL